MTKIYKIKIDGKVYEVELEEVTQTDEKITKNENLQGANKNLQGTEVSAPMQGVVLSINVNVGDTVKSGDTLLIIEAMKMENPILAPKDGKISNILVTKGETVNSGSVMITIS